MNARIADRIKIRPTDSIRCRARDESLVAVFPGYDCPPIQAILNAYPTVYTITRESRRGTRELLAIRY